MTAKAAPQLEDVLALVLRLPLLDRVRLIERVASSLESDLIAYGMADEGTASPHWGKRVIALLDEIDLSAWQDEEIDDPVDWVKRQRREKEERRAHDPKTAQSTA